MKIFIRVVLIEDENIYKSSLDRRCMNTATEDTVKIRTHSPEIFSEVINSVPLLPEKAELTFLADGINFSEFNGKKYREILFRVF